MLCEMVLGLQQQQRQHRYCCAHCRQHKWNHLKDETDLDMMLASTGSEDPLIFDDCTSIDTTSSGPISRHRRLPMPDVRVTSAALVDGVSNLNFLGSRRSLDGDDQSSSSGSGSGYSSEADDGHGQRSVELRPGKPGHLPISRSTLDPFPELSHSSPTPVTVGGCEGGEQGDEEGRGMPGGSRAHSSVALQMLNRRLSSRPLYHSSESLPGNMRPSSSLSTLSGSRDQSEKVTWLPSGLIKTMLVVHFEDKTSRSVSVDELTKACDLAHVLADLQGAAHDRSWSVVEVLARFQLERHLEDHESVYQIHKSWASMDNNRFVFRKEFRKYDFFVNPSQFFPAHMLDTKGSADINTSDGTGDRARNLLLQNLFGANARLPDVKGYLQMKEGKRSWKKHFFVLRENGLYYSLKGNSLDSKHLVLFCSLNDVLVYVAQNAKKTLGAPNNFCFCLKPTYNVTDVRQLKLLCADSEETRVCWIAALRIAKYGPQLSENFKKAVHSENAFIQSQYQEARRDNPLYVKERVAMDFSGQEGRVVGDPGEALGAAMEEAYNWRKRVARAHKSPPDSLGTSPVNCFLSENPARVLTVLSSGIHMAQPWFHGNISREEACELLLQQSVDGVFLIRDSQSVAGAYVLSFVHNHKVKHCPILRVEENGQMLFTLDGGRMRFIDLVQLVDFYQLNAAGLPTPLTHHVSRLL